MRFLFLLFIIMPVVEMWLLITVGNEIGALYTIGLVLLTAVIGLKMLRQQGFDTLWRGQRKLDEGQLPAQEIGEGIVLAVSGALLLTPGFMTDAIGFAGLVSPIRRLLVGQLLSKMVVSDLQGRRYGAYQEAGKPADTGNVIEGESWDKQDSVAKPEPQKNDDLP